MSSFGENVFKNHWISNKSIKKPTLVKSLRGGPRNNQYFQYFLLKNDIKIHIDKSRARSMNLIFTDFHHFQEGYKLARSRARFCFSAAKKIQLVLLYFLIYEASLINFRHVFCARSCKICSYQCENRTQLRGR